MERIYSDQCILKAFTRNFGDQIWNDQCPMGYDYINVVIINESNFIFWNKEINGSEDMFILKWNDNENGLVFLG